MANGIDLDMRVRGAAAVAGNLGQVKSRFSTSTTWVVGTSVEYSVYVEVGTSKMAAQPYLRPAVETVRRKVQSILDSAPDLDSALATIAYEIEREAKKRCPVDTGNLRASIRAEKR